MAFLVKAVKPPKINPQVYNLEIMKALNDEGKIIKRMYEKTTATWSRKTKPTWRIEVKVAAPPGPRGGVETRPAQVTVFPTPEEPFIFIDEGTKTRTIVPRRKPYLKFRVPYKARTRPRVLSSGRSMTGDQWVTTDRVSKHKIRARKFTVEIQKRRRKHFYSRMNKAMKDATRRAYQ